eukprot:577830-Pyramimonas_sp.AAC.1
MARAAANAKGSTTDAKGFTTDAKGITTDAKGSTTDLHELALRVDGARGGKRLEQVARPADAKGSTTDAKGSTTDAKGLHTCTSLRCASMARAAAKASSR